MKSCIKLANELNVSKQTIFNHAKRNNINLIKKDNTLYIESIDDINLITNKILKYKASKLNVDVEELKNNKHIKQKSIVNNEKELYTEIIKVKDETISSLKKDKEELINQINRLNDLLKQQQQLVYNQQSLALRDKDQASEKIQALETELNDLKSTNRNTYDKNEMIKENKNNLTNVSQKKSKGFFNRLFNK